MIGFKQHVTEGKQVGELYHFTDINSMDKILETNVMGVAGRASGKAPISFTRNKNFNPKGRGLGRSAQVMFVMDGNKLSNNYKVRPIAYDSISKSIAKGFEFEELLQGPIKNVKKYIRKIIILDKNYDMFKISHDNMEDFFKHHKIKWEVKS